MKKIFTPVLLMIISIALLLLLQVFWLRTEYRSNRDAFSRETNMIFRYTLYQLTDSIFFSSFHELQPEDTTKHHQFRRDDIRQISIKELPGKDSATVRTDSTDKQVQIITISLQDPENPTDSIHIKREIPSSTHDMRWMFTGNLIGFDTDLISKYYRRNLGADYKRLSLIILEKDFEAPSSRQLWHPQTVDTLPFQTNYYPFARKMYAAEFRKGNFFLWRKMMPQAGFALFTSALIIFSFIVVYRNLGIQKKLLEHKDNFISNVTHELKTPVASVGVALEALEKFNVLKDKDKALEYIELARKELNRLGLMTEKILKTSVNDYKDDIKLYQTVLSLEEIANDVLSSFQIIARHKDIILEAESKGHTGIRGNKEHITQMIFNLVDNAFKYAADGKYIKVNISEKPNDVVVTLEDKGPGIEPAHKNKIFEKFYRIPTGNIHDVKGYGLGLYYVAEVVKQHNGKITLESTPGEGCRFIVTLPKADLV